MKKMIDFAHHYSIDVMSLKENTITDKYLSNECNDVLDLFDKISSNTDSMSALIEYNL
jgi:hypothetical protein